MIISILGMKGAEAQGSSKCLKAELGRAPGQSGRKACCALPPSTQRLGRKPQIFDWVVNFLSPPQVSSVFPLTYSDTSGVRVLTGPVFGGKSLECVW